MSLGTGTAQSAEIVVFSTISAKEALIELVPAFERASGHKVNITYAGGSGLSKQILGGTQGDLFIGPEEFSDPLLKEGKLLTGSRTAFARSSTGLAVRAGAPKPDISSPFPGRTSRPRCGRYRAAVSRVTGGRCCPTASS